MAHHAGGVVIRPQPPRPPVPCAVYTGYAGEEGKIEVTNTGALMFVPASVPRDPTGTGTVPSGVPGGAQPGGQSMFSDGGVAVSGDDGASWKLVLPAGLSWVNDDNDAYVDPATGRFFASYIAADPPDQVPGRAPSAYNAAQAQIVMSPDDGRTWTESEACCEITDEGGFTAGPAPVGQPRPMGYPDVVYYCWQASQDVPPQPPARVCSRSLDGGASWQLAGFLARGVVPVHNSAQGGPCATPGSLPPSTAFTGGTSPADEVAGMPQVAPDGTLWAVLGCASDSDRNTARYYLVHSTDEGSTWPLAYPAAHPLPHAGQLRIDPAGNMYLMRATHPVAAPGGGTVGDAQLLLSVSTDHGRTWSREMNVAAPGIAWLESEDTALDPPGWSCCTQWYYDVRAPGQVAVAYNASTQNLDSAGNAPVNGYITETRDALAPDPVFWSGIVNDPAHPLKWGPGFPRGSGIYPLGPTGPGVLQGSAQTNALGLDIGPDGSAWGAFTEDCYNPDPARDRCVAQDHQVRGVAGRLVWPRS